MNMKPRDPPLFIVTKQFDIDIDNFFYQILESRESLRSQIISHISSKYSDQIWAKDILNGLISGEINLFMPFSHEALKAREHLENEMKTGFHINSIVEVGYVTDYITKKYHNLIRNGDELDKISIELL